MADLTQTIPGSKRGKAPRTQAMDQLALSFQEIRGLQLAQARGLHCLLNAYRKQLQSHWKSIASLQSTSNDASGQSLHGADGDYEAKYETLPLSPIFLQIVDSMTALNQEDIRKALWDVLNICEITLWRASRSR